MCQARQFQKKICDLMEEHSMTYLDLPIEDSTPKRVAFAAIDKNSAKMVVERDESHFLCVSFNRMELEKQTNHTTILTSIELRTAVIQWLRLNKPQVIECKVEADITSLGFAVFMDTSIFTGCTTNRTFLGRWEGICCTAISKQENHKGNNKSAP
mmetsp:Transcript_26077/g.26481  ORF Transcript_26077/g.26481 Transcript_26077/m.26481 type:complete len:155 (-) Transcript_26077:432-896(-)